MVKNSISDKQFWLSAIIDGSGVGTWLWNVQTGETQFNHRWAEIIGYSLEELEPVSIKTWERFAHPQDLERSAALLEAHFRGDSEFYHCEARMRHKNGHWVWVRDHGQLVTRTENGEPEWIAGSHTDITEEKELKLGLLRLDKIAKTIPGAIYEFRLDREGHGCFPYASGGIEHVYGVTPAQVKKDASAVYEAIHPDDLPKVQQSIQESFDTLEEWYCEYRTLAGDTEIWVTGYAIPEPHTDGSVSWFGQVMNTTQQKLTELELKESKKNLERAQRIGRLGYWQANLETGTLFWSDTIYDIFGVDKATFSPTVDAFSDAVHPEDIERVRESERQAVETGIHDVVHRIILPDGNIRWVHELADLKQHHGDTYLIGTVRDITEQKQYEIELERLSLTDALTGAHNRRYFDIRIEQLLDQVVKRDKRCSVAIIDIDHFKKVNDTYGHSAGDMVLQQLVQEARKAFRSIDLIARTGGEEFSVLLEDCSVEKAATRIEAFRKQIEQVVFQADRDTTFKITVTAGVTEIRTDDPNTANIVKRADKALYIGKQSGRNRVVKG